MSWYSPFFDQSSRNIDYKDLEKGGCNWHSSWEMTKSCELFHRRLPKKIIEGCQKNNLLLPLFFQERHEKLFDSLLCEELGFLSWQIEANYHVVSNLIFIITGTLPTREHLSWALNSRRWEEGHRLDCCHIELYYLFLWNFVRLNYIYFFLWNVVRLYCCFMECRQIILFV